MRFGRVVPPLIALRLALSVSGCVMSKAPTALVHPMLNNQSGGPHAAPFSTSEHIEFDGDPSQREFDAASQAKRNEVAQAARTYVGRRSITFAKQTLPFDCSGLARASYLSVGIDVMDLPPKSDENGVRTIYRYVKRNGLAYLQGPPAVGDLVFFNDTYDRNHNGLRDDQLTHVAVVETVDDDGTITVIHRVSRGVLRYKMNLRYPDALRSPANNKRINHYLRASDLTAPSQTTAQLFAGFGTVIRSAEQLPQQVMASKQ